MIMLKIISWIERMNIHRFVNEARIRKKVRNELNARTSKLKWVASTMVLIKSKSNLLICGGMCF